MTVRVGDRSREDPVREAMRLSSTPRTIITMTNRPLFVSHAVKDVKKSTAFFKKLGFATNKAFSGPHGTCLVINEHTCVMLVDLKLFKTFTKKEIANAKKVVEVGLTLQLGSRKEVDAMHAKAIKAGGKSTGTQDMEGMYSKDFDDLDGHNWGLTFMG